MLTSHVLAAPSAFAVLVLSLVNVSQAADPGPNLPALVESDESTDITTGGKWMVSADLECEIVEVTDQAVLVAITGVRAEAEQGVPMISKVPYVNRMFKNVGVAQIETRVVLSIPKDRIKQMVPVADDEPVSQGTQKSEAQQQVLVELKVLEISLSKIRKLGLSLGEMGLAGLVGTADRKAGQDHPATVILDGDDVALKFLAQLQKEGLAKTLAEPTLVTMSGRSASFRSGGEFPVPIAGRDKVEYREFGTRVDLLPVCLENGKVRLEIRPTISELDANHSVTVGNTLVPGLRVRTVKTTAELMPGQTLALTGLVQNAPAKAKANGEHREQETEETGLIVLATPTLVEGIKDLPASASADRKVYASPQAALRTR